MAERRTNFKFGLFIPSSYLCRPKNSSDRLFEKKDDHKLQLEYLTDFLFKNYLIMATNNIQNYEMMLIFTPVLADDEFKTAQKKFVSLIKENGGEIVHENTWGLKSLAYPIQKKTTGLYVVVEF